MIALACAEHPHFVPSLAEAGEDFSGAQLHYSVDTVRYFRHAYHGHGDRIYFIIGADAFLDIPVWKEYETLLGLCDFIVANRPGIRAEALRLVIPPDLMARGDLKKNGEAVSSQVVADLQHTSLSARNCFQRSFRHRHPPARQPRPGHSRTCLRSRRGIHFETGPIPMKFETLPQSVRLVVEAAQDKKASGITILDLREVGGFTSFFVICTGFSTPQVEAICDEVEEQLYKHLQRSPKHREGRASAEWALLDFGGFILHVFHEQARRYYDLERLWRSAPKLDIPDEPESPRATLRLLLGESHPPGEAVSK